jgi:hypothetical protein
VLVQQDIWFGTSFHGVTGVGFEDMYLVVVVTEACNMLRCRMCSSYTVVLVRLLAAEWVCQAADVAAASLTGSCDLPRPVFF